MFERRPALLLGALIGVCLSGSVRADGLGVKWSGEARPAVQLAQYYGPPDGGPFDGPDDGYGPSYGMDGSPLGDQDGRGGDAGEPRYRVSRHRQPAGGQHVDYHGFHIDLSESGGSRNLTGQIASMEHQIDIVGSVGLTMSDLRLFRSLPIKISASQRGGGHYDGGSSVQMGTLTASDRRPVLLHEFMHVYHHSHLPGGFQNPEVRAFYDEAVKRNLFPADSYMLKNPGEFFAMTASCYLYGTVARAPFTRDAIRTHQPDYYAYLGHLFGPPHGTHSAGLAPPGSRHPGALSDRRNLRDGTYH